MSSASRPATAPAASTEASPSAPSLPPAARAAGGGGGHAAKPYCMIFASVLLAVLSFAISSCGIPSVPYLAKPLLIGTPNDINDSFEFRNDPGSSLDVFDGFEIYYRLYLREVDAEADRISIASLLSADEGQTTYSRLSTLDFKRVVFLDEAEVWPPTEVFWPSDSPDLDYTVLVKLEPLSTSTATSSPSLFKRNMQRFNAKEFNESAIAETDADVEASQVEGGVPDAQVTLLAYICAHGFDFTNAIEYRSQFIAIKLSLN